MRAMAINLASAAAACAAMLTTTSASEAQVIQFVSQQRNIHSFVIVPLCQPSTMADQDEAAGTDPFESEVSSAQVCEAAGGLASAEQDSFIEGLMLASGGTHSTAFASAHQVVIHAISTSFYEVTFQVLQPAMFTRSAELSAEGALPVVLCGAETRLITAQGMGPLIFQHTVEPLPNGDPQSATIARSGTIQPGQYTFRASSNTVIDASIAPKDGGVGNASFDVQLDIARLGDLNGDGVVNSLDLGILLSSWSIPAGSPGCGGAASCPSDMNGDEFVNSLDLGILLASWTI